MQDCLSFGKPLLIENIEEELDPVLDPVLERRYVKKGRGFTVALADKEVCTLSAPLTKLLCCKAAAVSGSWSCSSLCATKQQTLGRW